MTQKTDAHGRHTRKSHTVLTTGRGLELQDGDDVSAHCHCALMHGSSHVYCNLESRDNVRCQSLHHVWTTAMRVFDVMGKSYRVFKASRYVDTRSKQSRQCRPAPRRVLNVWSHSVLNHGRSRSFMMLIALSAGAW